MSICRESGLGSGTVYPILERLREAGWIGYLVEANPAPGRLPRTFYHLTYRGQLGAGLESTRQP
ncbi:helix-turn-helix transcriptional regulator [Streptomyces sp. NPDC048448]|uniref:helix-turn-helix transcriptional regulator n=1 Tax=Streptomyces sp. NPDC048448 TaxID=3365554 RepID=UPI0037134DAF